MSGQQIGTVIGAVVGSFFGMPTLGAAIGGFLGGLIDPQKITGPHTTDTGRQTATDGQPIAWVQGTAWVTGTIVQASARRDVKVKDSGKGGPTVSHFEAHQDFAILLSESDVNRASRISGVLMVEQDGKIVYDMRPGSSIISDSQKWIRQVDFMYGDENQLPHPTLEAISGVGNTCSYRGVCVAVFKNFNVTNAGGRIPTFRFLVSGSTYVRFPTQQYWRYHVTALSDSTAYWDPAYDDASWPTGQAPFGNIDGDPTAGTDAHAFDDQLSSVIGTKVPLNIRTVIRKTTYLGAVPPSGYHMRGWLDNSFKLYVNGTFVTQNAVGHNGSFDLNIPSSAFQVGQNVLCVLCDDDAATSPDDVSYFDFYLDPLDVAGGEVPISLSSIVSNVMQRGGIPSTDLEVSAFDSTMVMGFPIAKQMSATDACGPLLSAYFAYMNEIDAKLRGAFMGANATITIDPNDLLESTDDAGAIAVTQRAQPTEFPKQIIGTYFDPAQNYLPVTVTRRRPAAAVNSTGVQNFDIPVAMAANDAIQAIDKALKLAYARLEGKVQFKMPFGGLGGVYLKLGPGEPFILKGKRYVIEEMTVSSGMIEVDAAYDRQSAVTSAVQAIPGLPPSQPQSTYSGPTQLMVMNLPISLRPQDTYGVYLAASSTTGSSNWRGCTVEISFDSQQTWQPATSINIPSVMGEIAVAQTAINGNFKVQVNGDLESVDSTQLAAGANAWCVLTSAGAPDIGQFKNATEDLVTEHLYLLDTVTQGLQGTTGSIHTVGQAFTMLENVYFVPINTAFRGQTLWLRATGYGETTSDATLVSFVYNPNTDIIYDAGTVTT